MLPKYQSRQIKPRYEWHPIMDPNHPLSIGCVGLWLFNETGGPTAYDLSGFHNNGTLTGGPTWSPGRSGQALKFTSGTNQHVNVVDNYSLDLGTGSKTLSAWIKTSVTGVIQNIIRKDNKAGGSGYLFRIEADNRLSILFADATVYAISYSVAGAVTDDRWHHIAGVYDRIAGYQYLYVDRNRVDSDALAMTGDVNNVFDLRIGAWYSETLVINGPIDEVRIYNRALSAAEVQWLYQLPYDNIIVEPTRKFWFVPEAGGATNYPRAVGGSLALGAGAVRRGFAGKRRPAGVL